ACSNHAGRTWRVGKPPFPPTSPLPTSFGRRGRARAMPAAVRCFRRLARLWLAFRTEPIFRRSPPRRSECRIVVADIPDTLVLKRHRAPEGRRATLWGRPATPALAPPCPLLGPRTPFGPRPAPTPR